MPEPNKIKEILDEGSFNDFVGFKEDQWFDAKGKDAYHGFGDTNDMYELAKDVTSFANSEGGYIVIGFKTDKPHDKNTEEVTELDLIERGEFDAGKYRGIINERSYPKIKDIEIGWLPSRSDAEKGAGFIFIPCQKEDLKPFMVSGVIEEGCQVKQIVFGVSRRIKDQSSSLTKEQMHNALQVGKNTVSQRLTAIEKKIDELKKPASKAGVDGPAHRLAERVNDMIQRAYER